MLLTVEGDWYRALGWPPISGPTPGEGETLRVRSNLCSSCSSKALCLTAAPSCFIMGSPGRGGCCCTDAACKQVRTSGGKCSMSSGVNCIRASARIAQAQPLLLVLPQQLLLLPLSLQQLDSRSPAVNLQPPRRLSISSRGICDSSTGDVCACGNTKKTEGP